MKDALESDLWAWERIPEKLVRYAWRSRGYTSFEEQAAILNMTVANLQKEEAEVHDWVQKSMKLESVPEVLPSELEWEMDPLPGEKEKVMLIEQGEGQWFSVPEWMRCELTTRLHTWRVAMNKVNLRIGQRALQGFQKTRPQTVALEKLQALNPSKIVFDLEQQAPVEGKLQVDLAKNYVQIEMKMDPPVMIAVGDGPAMKVKLVQRTLSEDHQSKPADALFMLRPSVINDLLDAYASDEDGKKEEGQPAEGEEEEGQKTEGDCEDIGLDQAPLEGEEEDASEEESDHDEVAIATAVAVDLENYNQHVSTVGPHGDTRIRVFRNGQWESVTNTTPLDARLQLPPRHGAKVQKHKDTPAGAQRWQAWYPGVEPRSKHSTGPDAREAVLTWVHEHHRQWLHQQGLFQTVD